MMSPHVVPGAIFYAGYEEDKETNQVKSLQTFCIKKLVSDVSLIEHNVQYLPNILKEKLMEEALLEGRYLSISLLMQYWPFEILHIPLPSELKGWNILRLAIRRQSSKVLDKLCSTTMLVLNCFFKLVQSNSFIGKLNTIDLSDVPLSDCGFQKICKEIDESSYNADESGIKYTIKTHCYLWTMLGVRNLLQVMEVQKLGSSRIKLVVTGLQFSGCVLHSNKIVPLLDSLSSRDLEKLSFEFARPTIDTIVKIFQKSKKFHNLKTLSFASFINCLIANDNVYTALKEFLLELVHVSHLNLSGCRMSNNLNCILQNLNMRKCDVSIKNSCKKFKTSCHHPDCIHLNYASLQYLDLSNCMLKDDDFLNLTNSRHIKNLKHLVVCCRYFQYFESLCSLLNAVAPTLHVLEIGNSWVDTHQIGPFFSVIAAMENLRFLDITRFSLDWKEQLRQLPLLQQLQNLKCLVLSAPSNSQGIDIIGGFVPGVEGIIKAFNRDIDIIWVI